MRLVETVKVIARFVDLGVLTRLPAPRPRDCVAALEIEDWMVGQPRPAVYPRAHPAVEPRPAAGADWSGVPLTAAVRSSSYAPIVPAQSATGEIQSALGVIPLSAHAAVAAVNPFSRADAHFSDRDEAFFGQASALRPVPLDGSNEEFSLLGFWQRLFGKRSPVHRKRPQ